MSAVTLTKTGVSSGVWNGILMGCDASNVPQINVVFQGQILKEIHPEQIEGSETWTVKFEVEASQLSEGISTYLFVDNSTNETLTSFSILAGDAVADDIRAEVELLRAELDMFKRVFRQHCIQTM